MWKGGTLNYPTLVWTGFLKNSQTPLQLQLGRFLGAIFEACFLQLVNKIAAMIDSFSSSIHPIFS
jgi:hypothetical protein